MWMMQPISWRALFLEMLKNSIRETRFAWLAAPEVRRKPALPEWRHDLH